ncbi:Serine acetyltransferase [Phytophthora palmivora]|uniref:Serine acetyltransferase n=1 Tax=Phytophthora palmivora TaxID=4796 RepID=A0A2P4YF43_9STRA|nr:Serine acetyltransferase [Phytophthora palmivora]
MFRLQEETYTQDRYTTPLTCSIYRVAYREDVGTASREPKSPLDHEAEGGLGQGTFGHSLHALQRQQYPNRKWRPGFQDTATNSSSPENTFRGYRLDPRVSFDEGMSVRAGEIQHMGNEILHDVLRGYGVLFEVWNSIVTDIRRT